MADRTVSEGFTMIPHWLIRESNLTQHELLVYIVLLDHRDHISGEAFPAIETIAAEARISKSSVIRTVKLLASRRLIAITKVPVAGNRVKNVYAVKLPDEVSGVRETASGVTKTPDRVSTGTGRRTTEEEPVEVDLKPTGVGDRIISHPSAPATQAQITWLHDIHVFLTGALWTHEERAREQARTVAEADEAIRFGWSDVQHEGRDNIAARIPKPYLQYLSERALAWLHGIPAKDAA